MSSSINVENDEPCSFKSPPKMSNYLIQSHSTPLKKDIPLALGTAISSQHQSSNAKIYKKSIWTKE